MARLKFSISASVFLTSVEYTSLPTIGQKGTFVPSSCDTANARAVLPVPGPPANSTALPDIFFALMRSTTTPQAFEHQSNIVQMEKRLALTSRAAVCPTKPLPEVSAVPSFLKPSPLMCV